MNPNDPLPPHANGYAMNEITKEIVAVQIVDGKCFYYGGEKTEVVELGPQWKPVTTSKRTIVILILVLIVCVAITYSCHSAI